MNNNHSPFRAEIFVISLGLLAMLVSSCTTTRRNGRHNIACNPSYANALGRDDALKGRPSQPGMNKSSFCAQSKVFSQDQFVQAYRDGFHQGLKQNCTGPNASYLAKADAKQIDGTRPGKEQLLTCKSRDYSFASVFKDYDRTYQQTRCSQDIAGTLGTKFAKSNLSEAAPAYFASCGKIDEINKLNRAFELGYEVEKQKMNAAEDQVRETNESYYDSDREYDRYYQRNRRYRRTTPTYRTEERVGSYRYPAPRIKIEIHTPKSSHKYRYKRQKKSHKQRLIEKYDQ